MKKALFFLFAFSISVYSDTLDVAIYSFPPCVITEEGKVPTGFDIEVLEKVCKNANLQIRYIYADSFPELLDGVEDGRFDCAASGITITRERENRADFTHPYLNNSGLCILLNKDAKISVLKTMFRYVIEFSPMLILVTIFTAIFGVLIFFIERRFSKNASLFNPDKPALGIFNGYYFSNVASTTMGFGDFFAKSVLGKLLVIYMSYIGIYFILPYATANMNIVMQKENEVYLINGPEDLLDKNVGTEKETTSETFLRKLGCNDVETFSSINEAYKDLGRKKLDAVVFDMPSVKYFVNTKGKKKFITSGPVFDKQMYGFALTKNSPYREAINEYLVDFMRTPEYWELHDKWFGTTE